jgi:hypothetical protein
MTDTTQGKPIPSGIGFFFKPPEGEAATGARLCLDTLHLDS